MLNLNSIGFGLEKAIGDKTRTRFASLLILNLFKENTMSHKITNEEMGALLIKASHNLNNAGFNDSVGRLLMQAVKDLSNPIPTEDVSFLNEWCERLENCELSDDPMEAFDLVSDLSQIAKRFVIARSAEQSNVA